MVKISSLDRLFVKYISLPHQCVAPIINFSFI